MIHRNWLSRSAISLNLENYLDNKCSPQTLLTEVNKEQRKGKAYPKRGLSQIDQLAGLQQALQDAQPKLTIDYLTLARQSAEIMNLIVDTFESDERFFREKNDGCMAVYTYQSILFHAVDKAKWGSREDREGWTDVKKFGCYSLTLAAGVMQDFIEKLPK